MQSSGWIKSLSNENVVAIMREKINLVIIGMQNRIWIRK
jgi:hypothetical protein